MIIALEVEHKGPTYTMHGYHTALSSLLYSSVIAISGRFLQ